METKSIVRPGQSCKYYSGGGLRGTGRAQFSIKVKGGNLNTNKPFPLYPEDVLPGVYCFAQPGSIPGSVATTVLPSQTETITGSTSRMPRMKSLSVTHSMREAATRTFDVCIKKHVLVTDGYRNYTTPVAPTQTYTYDMYLCRCEAPPAFPAASAAPSDAEIAAFVSEATQAMYPSMKGEFEGFVFAGEAVGFSALISQIGKIAKLLASLLSGGLARRGDTLATIGASSDLAYNFAIKPLIADLAQLSTMYNRAADHYAGKAAKGQLGETRHYSIEEEISNDESRNGWYIERTRVTRKWSATWRLKYRIRDTVPRDMWQYFGLAPSFRGMWELLPLSFVVDRVLAMDTFIKSLDRERRIDVMTDDFCWSCKIDGQRSRELPIGLHGYGSIYSTIYVADASGSGFNQPGAMPQNPGGNYVASCARDTLYIRRPALPILDVALPSLKVRPTDKSWPYSMAILALVGARKEFRNVTSAKRVKLLRYREGEVPHWGRHRRRSVKRR